MGSLLSPPALSVPVPKTGLDPAPLAVGRYPLKKEEARDPGLALVPLFVPVLAVPFLENLQVEVAVLALLDRRIETLEALIADGDPYILRF